MASKVESQTNRESAIVISFCEGRAIVGAIERSQGMAEMENRLQSQLETTSARAQANRAALLTLMGAMREQTETICAGGGEKAVAAQHAKGRLTVRERIARLIDPDTELLELGLWAAHGMYAEFGGAPAAGVVTGLGRVCGRLCMIIANDATVKA